MVRCSAVVLAKAEDLHYSLIEELSNSVKQTIAALSGYVSPSGVLIKYFQVRLLVGGVHLL